MISKNLKFKRSSTWGLSDYGEGLVRCCDGFPDLGPKLFEVDANLQAFYLSG